MPFGGGVNMNDWTKLSVELANQRNYLDLLFKVYPTIPEDCREIDQHKWEEVEQAFGSRNNEVLIEKLLDLNLFPIKDSYVAYLRHDRTAIKRNPCTVARLAGRMYELGLSKLYENCSQPKEANRQIGPLFKRWVGIGSLGVIPVSYKDFINSSGNAIMDGSDAEMMHFAKEYLGYNHEKGLDLVARFNGKYVIGEAKFLTDHGGHQNAQFNDAISTLNAKCNALTIAVLDGVCYIQGNNKLYRELSSKNRNIMSALVLREFLYQI